MFLELVLGSCCLHLFRKCLPVWAIFFAFSVQASAIELAQADGEIELSISQQTAEESLKGLASAFGTSILYQTNDVAEIGVNAVQGSFTLSRALKVMLEGTRLRGGLTKSGIITICAESTDEQGQLGEVMDISKVCAAEKKRLPSLGRLLGTVAAVFTTATMPTSSEVKAQEFAIEEIVVTARKRAESLQDIPLAITAFTAQDIEDAGIQGLQDIALQTAGMEFNARASGNQVAGRADSVIRLRGVDNGDLDHLQPTSLFVDGIYVLGTAGSIGLQDLERVEVIKGPQSAFFGRNTFAGAINYITKSPGLEEYETKLDFSLATYEKYDINVLHSGPIIEGKLAYQFSVRGYHQGAEWQATDGGGLGEESSYNISGVLYGEPSENLSFKLRASYLVDDDGPPVAGIILGRKADSCSGTTIERFDEDGNLATFFPTNYICGEIPSFGYTEAADSSFAAPGFVGGPRTILSRGTTVQPPLFFQDRNGFILGTGEPLIGPQPNAIVELLGGENASEYLGKTVPQLNEFGLKRNQVRVALNSDYEFDNGYTANFLAGYNVSRMNNLYDFDLIDESVWTNVLPKYAEDWSVEARINSPVDERFRWLVGATYYDQTFINGGGIYLTSCFVSCGVGPVQLTLPPNLGNEAQVWGVYGSASYDITDDLTLDVETRYLQDERTVEQAGVSFTDTFKQFTPRVILNYKPTEQTTLYAQFSRGALPGATNGLVTTCSEDEFLVPYIDPASGQPSTASECDQIRAQAGEDARGSTPSQKLNAFEIGLKQSFLENRVRFNFIGWHYKWNNRPFTVTVSSFLDATDPAQRDRIPNTFPNLQSIQASGSQELWGLEWESGFDVTENWDAQLNVSWSDNKFTEFSNTFFVPTAGVSNLKGSKIQRYPAWMGNLATTYRNQLSNEWDWYARADFMYQGEYWVDNINLARAPDYLLTNARVGITREDIRIEFFVRNLFQTEAWASARTLADNTTTSLNFGALKGIAVTPQEKRTFGIRSSMTF